MVRDQLGRLSIGQERVRRGGISGFYDWPMAPSIPRMVLIAALLASPSLGGQPSPPAPAQPTPAAAGERSVVEALRAEAALLKELTWSKVAWEFLDATSTLIDPGVRTVYRNREKGVTLTPDQFGKLPEEEREGFVKRELPARFYYYTGYGSPLVFVRALDLLSHNEDDRWAPDEMPRKKIIDFGCGTIGHLRLLAALGADATGIDIEPMFDALYSEPGDQGNVAGKYERTGQVRILTGRWPADEAIVERVNERRGEGYDLFISKNTLKRGYIHPARETDPSRLVHLGVSDEVFVRAVYDTLKPGGVFLIYNISPAQAPPEEPYLPHADGECPFPRELLEKTGFEVVTFDEKDQEAILGYWKALGYDNGQAEDVTRRDLFAWWTMCRKPGRAGEMESDAGR